jgi:hypothetical protein
VGFAVWSSQNAIGQVATAHTGTEAGPASGAGPGCDERSRQDAHGAESHAEQAAQATAKSATREQLVESLRITLREALEFNRCDTLEAAGEGFDEESIAL